MTDSPDVEVNEKKVPDELTAAIIRCVIKVHKSLGPGFVESVYRNALVNELAASGLKTEADKEVVVSYEGQSVGACKLDIVVDDKVILAVKTVEALGPIHYSQMRSYLRTAGLEVGLLLNFALDKSDFRRVEL